MGQHERKKSGNKPSVTMIVLVTAILQLITSIIKLILALIDR